VWIQKGQPIQNWAENRLVGLSQNKRILFLFWELLHRGCPCAAQPGPKWASPGPGGPGPAQPWAGQGEPGRARARLGPVWPDRARPYTDPSGSVQC